MVAVGGVFVALSLVAKGLSYRMPPHPNKPSYAVTPRLRIMLLSLGLLCFGLGLAGLLRT